MAFSVALQMLGGAFNIIDALRAFGKLGSISGPLLDAKITSGYRIAFVRAKIHFVLRDVEFRPSWPAPRVLPPEARFEVVPKLKIQFTRGEEHESMGPAAAGAIGTFMTDALESNPRFQAAARDLLGWLIGDRGRLVKRLNETLTSSLPEHSRNKPQNNVVELHPETSETP